MPLTTYPIQRPGLKKQVEAENLPYYKNLTEEGLNKIYEETVKKHEETLKRLANE